jgi:sec-independent protein translocase protein TatA
VPNIGPMEIAVVLIIALVIFGPKKLPELGRGLGQGIREFKGSISGRDEDTPRPQRLTPGPTESIQSGTVADKNP